MSANQSVQSNSSRSQAVSNEPEIGDLLHLAGVSSDGRLWHTLRYDSGAWSTFEDVEATAGDIGSVVDADFQYSSGPIHLCAVDGSGGLWYSTRAIGWTTFDDVKAHAGDRGNFSRVALGSTGGFRDGLLHVCGVTDDGLLWHAIRQVTGVWEPFFDVASEAGDRGGVVQVSCVARAHPFAFELHLCAVTDDGGLWTTIRKADGHWTPFIDVKRRAGNRGHFIDVDCALVGGEMHVSAITRDGRLWHAIRRLDTSWVPFEDVQAKAGDRGSFVSVATGSGAGGAVGGPILQLAGVTGDGRLWHSIRTISGSWSSFEDIEAAAGERGDFASVGAGSLHVIP